LPHAGIAAREFSRPESERMKMQSFQCNTSRRGRSSNTLAPIAQFGGQPVRKLGVVDGLVSVAQCAWGPRFAVEHGRFVVTLQ
jgi:hypothetical protein